MDWTNRNATNYSQMASIRLDHHADEQNFVQGLQGLTHKRMFCCRLRARSARAAVA
jgi:hypothetical protein